MGSGLPMGEMEMFWDQTVVAQPCHSTKNHRALAG